MPKLAVIINGRPGAGKDFLCDAVVGQGRALKVSSIDPILGIASREFGWDGIKDAKGRKLLSGLKRVSAEYNDLPNRCVLRAYEDFLQSEAEVLFVHIREEDQIEAFKAAAGNCVTLLIRRPGTDGTAGNASDDGVEGIRYDYIFTNDKPPEQAGELFQNFIGELLSRHA
ncbi:MAG: hypothetical protein LBH95_09550 [Oscillospiraceae bacterium]|jgi:hypothetical protein|nr:hypothetical protein [Oscillospiraceae bacterium]